MRCGQPVVAASSTPLTQQQPTFGLAERGDACGTWRSGIALVANYSESAHTLQR